MKRKLVFCLGLCAVASAAHAADNEFCSAIAGLKDEASTSHVAQRVAIFKAEPMTFACQRKKEVSAQTAFCSAAASAVGIEFTHVFPWKVYDCLKQSGIKTYVTTVDEYTGLKYRKKITHLWAGWRDGTRLDIRFEPTGDFGHQPRFRNYWGTYRMVVWHP